jgi:putative acetyltransferase
VNNVEIRQIPEINNPGLASLVAKSDAYLSSLYPPESNHAEPLGVLTGRGSAFFAAYIGEQPVACGAVKIVDGDPRYGEIKRLFVDENQRGKRLAITMMQHIENYLSENGISIARLEAGPMQPEALSLYSKLGYDYRGPFGKYKIDPLSVFMEKDL